MTQPDPTAVLARIRQMADYWEQHLPEVIRTPAVVSAIRAALKPAVVPPADQAAFEADVDSQTGPKAASKDPTVLRDRIRRAVCEAEGFAWDSDMLEPDEYGEVADMVLAVLPPPVDRAACICGHTEQQHFEDVCITELTGCACGYFLPVEAAAEEIARLARGAAENRLALSQALGLGTGAPWSAIRERAAELRRLAAETQQQPDTETEGAACTCGRTACESDLCDCDATPCPVDHAAVEARQDGAQRPEVVHGCPPNGSGLTPCCGRTPFELPLSDRISTEAPVTCPGPAVLVQPAAADTDEETRP